MIGKRLDGKAALVTGAASGIGKGIATWFVREGAKVILADISEEGLQAATQELGGDCVGIKVDVTSEADIEKAVSASVEAFGKLDVAVNCAGMGGLMSIVDMSEDIWDMVMDIDLKGVMLCMKHEATQMIAQGKGGSIINIASLNSRQPAEGMSAYCSAKAGVEMLTKVGAMELGPNKIRVNAISPGLIETPLTSSLFSVPLVNAGFIENTPLGRSGTTDDVAAVALFLASDESCWMSGDNLFIDGGALTKRYPEIIKLMMAE
jgi:NAD(P)-dependent dehydrogenase (short-subunit alcohol dehydrogenase family)